MNKFNLDIFHDNFFNWVESFKITNIAGDFSVIRGKKKSSLYGICDMVFNLTIPDQIEHYLNIHEIENREAWIEKIQSYQDSKTGWFKDDYFNYKFRSPLTGQWEHASAFAVSALKLLNATPKYDFQITKKLNSKRQVEKWLKNVPEWGIFLWPGSHRGGGIGAIFAMLGEDYYPHENFFDWYFGWLNSKADPIVGFWRLGWNHKIKKRLTKHELGGAIHYYWVYEYMQRPISYPDKVIDSTLQLQNEIGLWGGDVSYCIDLDAIFSLLRCSKQLGGYREDDIHQAIHKYLEYTIPSLNNKDFLFNRYTSAHRLTGCLEAIAEIYKYKPELFDLSGKWIETLDIACWI